MKKWLKRIVIIIVIGLTIPALVYHLGLREWCLHWGTTSAEAHRALPGDELFPAYTGEATHAITIHAAPEKIWPWLMQIGQDRSGFYSYTFLENAFGCDMPKVERLVPDWKPRTRGEAVWFCDPKRYNGEGKMIPAVVETDRSFAMIMPADWKRVERGGPAREGMWSFTLQSAEGGNTRLIARLRNGPPPTLGALMMGRLFWEPAHFVMEQKMLRTIRDLAERS
ncbi:MAG TPA: hypothetical protein VMS18_29695 [Candidatus Binatia bacterium]|nr:hypothetical protein [Candidatus Binatia bacterium]